MDDLKERLRKVEGSVEYGADPGGTVTCWHRNPDGPEASARIEALEQRVSELEEALRQADEAMTCRRDDDAHYCPNCDNSLYEARGKIRAALNREPNP
jgi:hypothetical protein